MKRTLVVVAAVVGFAAAASASTLSVISTTTSNVVQNTFAPGDTIVLRITGDATGVTSNGIHGELTYNGALTTDVGGTQGDWYSTLGTQFLGDGVSVAFDQGNGQANPTAPNNQISTSTITLLADATGISIVRWGGENLQFFDIYTSSGGFGDMPDAHSFTIIPEPATAGLIGLGLLGLVLGGRRRS